MKRKFGLIVLLVSLSLGLVSCFGLGKQEFEKDGLTITLAKGFKQKDVEGLDVSLYLEARNNAFMFNRQFKKDVGDYSLEKYTHLLINDSDYSAGSKIEHYLDDNVEFYYFTYTAVIAGDEFAYFVAVYDSEYYYYVVNFFCLETNFKRWSKKYMEWAKTVKIA